MNTTRYMIVTLTAFFGLLMLAAANAWVQSGTATRNGYYTCTYVDAKIAKGRAVLSPKLVVISGSNSLAGISVRSIAPALAIRGFNFGLSASYGPGFQTFEGMKILRPGDAALLPLEYLAYDYSTPRTSLVDAVYSCGTDYWRSLDWREKLFFVLAVRPQRIFDAIRFGFDHDAHARIRSMVAEDVDEYGEHASRVAGRGGKAVNDETGLADVGTHEPLEIHFDRESPGVQAIAAFAAWSKSHHVTVFATWPNTEYFPQYRSYAVFRTIRDFYRSLGVDVVGAPEDSMFPASLMSGTIYHLGAEGIVIRTSRLAQRLRIDPAFIAWQHTSGPTAVRAAR